MIFRKSKKSESTLGCQQPAMAVSKPLLPQKVEPTLLEKLGGSPKSKI
jgi:hypothetical protein